MFSHLEWLEISPSIYGTYYCYHYEKQPLLILGIFFGSYQFFLSVDFSLVLLSFHNPIFPIIYFFCLKTYSRRHVFHCETKKT